LVDMLFLSEPGFSGFYDYRD